MRHFVVIHFPLVDVRQIIDPAKTNLLPSPTWPIPEHTHFIRSFGKIRTRKGGYEEGFWLGNNIFCDAAQAVKFPDHLDLGKGLVDKVYVKRRFFSTGFAVSWFELIFSIRQNDAVDAAKANANFEAVLERIIALKIKIAQKGKAPAEYPILEAGPALAKRYLENSTHSKASPPEKWWVSDGQPIMMIIAPDSKEKVKGVVTDPYRDSSFRNIGLDDIYHYNLLSPSEATTAIWRFHLNAALSTQFENEIRSFRLNILRLHVEKECLLRMLRHIKGNRFVLEREAQECQNLQYYLANSLKKLQLAQKNPDANPAMLTRVFQLNELANAKEISALLQQLEVIRGTLLRNLGDFLNTASVASA